MPFRGVDSSYSNRWCSEGEALIDPDTGDALFDPETGDVLGVNVTTPSEPCNHYEPEEIAVIPHISDNVKAALDFLSKDDDGFFLMYEQGDVSQLLRSLSLQCRKKVTLSKCTAPDVI